MKAKYQKLFLLFFLLCLTALPGQSAFAGTNGAASAKIREQAWVNISVSARTGWQYIDGKWYYYDSSGRMLTGWQKIGGKWYYLSGADNGAMLTGLQKIGSSTFFFNSSGAMATGWQCVGGKWYYFDANGYGQTGWKRLGGKWYYLNKADNGAMLTGLQKIGSSTFFFNSSGAMATGWQYVGGKWYYFDANGYGQTGWKYLGGKWYYLNKADNGAMLTGLQKIGSSTFFFNSSGAMATGWQYAGGKWYYFDANGYGQTGWKYLGGKWYYLNKADNGAMLTGWQQLDNKWYYFTYSGDMLTAFQILGGKAYYFGSDGALQEDWASENVIVIDPGHSSEIPDTKVPLGPGSSEMKDADNYGATSITNGLHEYELVLDVSLLLRDKLEARGYKVVMVRTTNTGKYSCVDRAMVANNNNAAIFLRVHANAAPKDHSKNGAMTICITKDNPFIPSMYRKSRLLSDLILSNYVSTVGCYNEGVWERDDMIANNWSKVPTTLVELGYMTNSKEDQLMQTSAYQEKMANGLLYGIDAYFKETAK